MSSTVDKHSVYDTCLVGYVAMPLMAIPKVSRFIPRSGKEINKNQTFIQFNLNAYVYSEASTRHKKLFNVKLISVR